LAVAEELHVYTYVPAVENVSVALFSDATRPPSLYKEAFTSLFREETVHKTTVVAGYVIELGVIVRLIEGVLLLTLPVKFIVVVLAV